MLTTALISLFLSTPAHALDCAAAGVGATLPADGAEEVAVNARPMVEIYGDADRISLELWQDGALLEGVAWERIAEGDPEVWQAQPEGLLAADAAFTLRAFEDSAEAEPWQLREVSFRTGSAEDLEPPHQHSGVAWWIIDSEDDWGPERRHEFTMYGGGDTTSTAWIIELGDGSEEGEVARRMRLSNPAVVSHGLCSFDSAADPAVEWQSAFITPVDLAGNEGEGSGALPETDFVFVCGTRGSAFCSAVPAPVFSLFGLLVGGLGALRRRRA